MTADYSQIQTCREAMKTHHDLYNKLYHRIAKLHAQYHVLDFWEYWGILLSCFAPERHHKLMKRVNRFVKGQRKNTDLAYDVHFWLKNLLDPTTFMGTCLTRPRYDWAYHLQWPGEGLITCTTRAAAMQTPKGSYTRGDLLQYKEGGVDKIGIAFGFASTNSARIPYLVFLYPCVQATDTLWNKQTDSFAAIRAELVISALMYSAFDATGAIALSLIHI